MAYVVLPNSGQSLGVTRPQINTNFSLIQSVFDVNHYDYNVTGAGKHLFVEIPVRVLNNAQIDALTLSGEGALYTKTILAKSQLFYVRDASHLNEVQLTGTVDISTPTVSGSTSLPGGLMLQWGLKSAATNNTVVTFKTPFTLAGVNTPPYSINLSIINAGGLNYRAFLGVKATTVAFDQFQITYGDQNANASASDIYWMAIGPNT